MTLSTNNRRWTEFDGAVLTSDEDASEGGECDEGKSEEGDGEEENARTPTDAHDEDAHTPTDAAEDDSQASQDGVTDVIFFLCMPFHCTQNSKLFYKQNKIYLSI